MENKLILTLNKEIKFRRAFLFDEEKTKFSHFSEWGVNVGSTSFTSPSSNNFAYYFIDCQFTGKKDDNGTDICESDVVEFSLAHDKESHLQRSTVEWFKYAFRLKRLWLLTEVSTIRRIGNIFENPELINQ